MKNSLSTEGIINKFVIAIGDYPNSVMVRDPTWELEYQGEMTDEKALEVTKDNYLCNAIFRMALDIREIRRTK